MCSHMIVKRLEHHTMLHPVDCIGKNSNVCICIIDGSYVCYDHMCNCMCIIGQLIMAKPS